MGLSGASSRPCASIIRQHGSSEMISSQISDVVIQFPWHRLKALFLPCGHGSFVGTVLNRGGTVLPGCKHGEQRVQKLVPCGTDLRFEWRADQTGNRGNKRNKAASPSGGRRRLFLLRCPSAPPSSGCGAGSIVVFRKASSISSGWQKRKKALSG